MVRAPTGSERTWIRVTFRIKRDLLCYIVVNVKDLYLHLKKEKKKLKTPASNNHRNTFSLFIIIDEVISAKSKFRKLWGAVA